MINSLFKIPALLTLCVVFLSGLGNASDNLSARLTAQNFMELTTQGKSAEAIQLYMHPRVKELLGDVLTDGVAQQQAYGANLGGFQSIEMISEHQLGNRLVKYEYVIYTPSLPVAYVLYVYSSDEGWKVTSFQFDTDLSMLK